MRASERRRRARAAGRSGARRRFPKPKRPSSVTMSRSRARRWCWKPSSSTRISAPNPEIARRPTRPRSRPTSTGTRARVGCQDQRLVAHPDDVSRDTMSIRQGVDILPVAATEAARRERYPVAPLAQTRCQPGRERGLAGASDDQASDRDDPARQAALGHPIAPRRETGGFGLPARSRRLTRSSGSQPARRRSHCGC